MPPNAHRCSSRLDLRRHAGRGQCRCSQVPITQPSAIVAELSNAASLREGSEQPTDRRGGGAEDRDGLQGATPPTGPRECYGIRDAKVMVVSRARRCRLTTKLTGAARGAKRRRAAFSAAGCWAAPAYDAEFNRSTLSD